MQSNTVEAQGMRRFLPPSRKKKLIDIVPGAKSKFNFKFKCRTENITTNKYTNLSIPHGAFGKRFFSIKPSLMLQKNVSEFNKLQSKFVVLRSTRTTHLDKCSMSADATNKLFRSAFHVSSIGMETQVLKMAII